MEGKLCILNEYFESLRLMLEYIRHKNFDVLDEFNSRHDGFIENLREKDNEINKFIDQMEPEKSNFLTGLLSGKKFDYCPAWADELSYVCRSQREVIENLINTNYQCVDLIQKEMEEVQTELKKTNKSDTVFNYYSNLKGFQTGMVFDIKN